MCVHPLSNRLEPERRAVYRGPDRRNLPHFICPICDTLSTSHVVEGRMNYREGRYWRRHRCHHCNEVFTTTQYVEPIRRPSRDRRPPNGQDLESP